MKQSQINPGDITKPIQIIAIWFIGLIVLVGTFLAGAVNIKDPPWLPVTLAITGIVIVPVFAVIIFVLQTKFRTQFLDDPYYSDWLKAQQEEFKDFRPERLQATSRPKGFKGKVDEPWEEREQKRIQQYENNRGIFLVHTWRPSQISEQAADISINLLQHGDGPLNLGKVKSVEYHLGPKFFTYTITKTDASDDFALRISAYGPFLCLARVNLKDDSLPLELERYINF